MTPERFRPWLQAWDAALYGTDGFYRSLAAGGGPAAHFRTACHAAPALVAEAVSRLAGAVGARTVVDVGAGGGELVSALAHGDDGGRDHALGLHGVDVAARPAGVPARVSWSAPGMPLPGPAPVLVTAFELLDVVPCEVLEVADNGMARVVEVDPRGRERPGAAAGAEALAWARRWWPGAAPGDRLEIGSSRDAAWAQLVREVAAAGGGLLLAVDYGHLRESRPPDGSLAAFRAGRGVPPAPDGSCDLTAHVAWDAVAAAGVAAGAGPALLLPQHEALRALLPPALLSAPGAGELLDPGSLGGFGWLLQPVGPALTADLPALTANLPGLPAHLAALPGRVLGAVGA